MNSLSVSVSGAFMSIVNAALYPLSDPDRRAAIVERATRQLGEDGAAAFPDFIAPEALAVMVAEATSKFPLAYRRDQRLGFNPQGPIAETADEELRSRTSPYSMWILGSDLLDTDGGPRRLYESEDRFYVISDARGIESLYTNAHPPI